MTYKNTKQSHRVIRHRRVRAKISGTAQRPRVSVFKSTQHFYAQAIDDTAAKTLVGVDDTADQKLSEPKELGAKARRAFSAGQRLAGMLKEKGVTKAVFDTGGFRYHGRVKAFAEGLRLGGITV